MKVLLLTASYGAGHNSAARALQEEWQARGAVVQLRDCCEAALGALYHWSCAMYRKICQGEAFLWQLCFEQLDSCEFSAQSSWGMLKKIQRCLEGEIQALQPDLIISTYPLYGHLLHHIREGGTALPPCITVVTDALAVGRVWVRAHADLLCVTDEHTRQNLQERFALNPAQIVACGFPTAQAFYANAELSVPHAKNLRLIYLAQAPHAQVKEELLALQTHYPHASVTLLAPHGLPKDTPLPPHWQVMPRSNDMATLMRTHHLYIGKSGGATVFECYASQIPLLVNHALPGQEEGNCQLLEQDGCGLRVQGAHSLLRALGQLLDNHAALWQQMRARMKQRSIEQASQRICTHIEQNFFA